jgi:hypothetical protein
MSVIYQKKMTTSSPTDAFSRRLNETQDYFAQRHQTNIIGKNFEDILTDNVLYEDYMNHLCEGFEATEMAQLKEMADSTRENILTESLEGVQPYASLTMPILVKLWARLSLKYAIPTEPVTVPAFSVAFMKPYILGADGKTKHYLPECLNMYDNELAELYQLPMNEGFAQNPDFDPATDPTDPAGEFFAKATITKDGITAITPVTRTAVEADPTAADAAIPGEIQLGVGGKIEKFNLFTASMIFDHKHPTNDARYAVDRKFVVTDVYYPVVQADGTTVVVTPIKVNAKVDLYRRLYADVFFTEYDATGAMISTKDTIFGSVDLENGFLEFVSMSGRAVKIRVMAFLSSETHQKATNVDFEIDKRDIEIGVGEHIESSLPLEFLQDVKAMYQVDGAAELIDIMSNVCAQKVDQRIYQFLERAYAGTQAQYRKSFNVYPSGHFAMNPSEWLNELKKLFDLLATKMRGDYKCYNGYFVIVGNPIDTNILPNVSWSFNSVNDQQNGVEVQYSIGAISGANKYTIISSDLIPQGELTMFFVPTTDKFKTFEYYPYTFNVVKNYLNTVNQNVPSIMLTKRDTIEEFVPIIAKVIIKNNDGSVYDRV